MALHRTYPDGRRQHVRTTRALVLLAAVGRRRPPTATCEARAAECGSPTTLLRDQIALLEKALGATRSLVIPLDLANDGLVRTDSLVSGTMYVTENSGHHP